MGASARVVAVFLAGVAVVAASTGAARAQNDKEGVDAKQALSRVRAELRSLSAHYRREEARLKRKISKAPSPAARTTAADELVELVKARDTDMAAYDGHIKTLKRLDGHVYENKVVVFRTLSGEIKLVRPQAWGDLVRTSDGKIFSPAMNQYVPIMPGYHAVVDNDTGQVFVVRDRDKTLARGKVVGIRLTAMDRVNVNSVVLKIQRGRMTVKGVITVTLRMGALGALMAGGKKGSAYVATTKTWLTGSVVKKGSSFTMSGTTRMHTKLDRGSQGSTRANKVGGWSATMDANGKIVGRFKNDGEADVQVFHAQLDKAL